MKRDIQKLSSLAIVAMLMAGCAGTVPSPSPSASAQSSQAATAAASEDLTGVKLTLWAPSNQNEVMKKIYAAFEAKTGIKIDVTPIPIEQHTTVALTKWQAGERPDLMFWFPDATTMGTLDPTNNLRDLSQTTFVSKETPAYVKQVTIGGKVLGAIIFPAGMQGVWWNKKIYAELGLDAPKTYQDLVDDCTVLKKKQAANPDFVPYIMAGSTGYASGYFTRLAAWEELGDQNPGLMEKLNTNKIKWTDKIFEDALLKAKALWDQGCYNTKAFSTTTDEQQRAAVVEGTAGAMALDQGNLYAMADKYGKNVIDETLGFATPGATSNKVFYGFGNWEALLLPKTGDAKREAAADKFLDYMATDGQAALVAAGFYPTLQGFDAPTNAPAPVKEAYDLLAANGAESWGTGGCCDAGPQVEFFNAMYVGTMTPLQVLETFQRAWERSAKEKGIPGF